MNLKWKTWRILNRMRTGVAPVKSNLAKRKITNADEVLCDCGEVQTTEHLRTYMHCPSKCILDDLWLDEALDVGEKRLVTKMLQKTLNVQDDFLHQGD